MKETFYFSHDYNARTDTKIRNLIRKHKLLGYGIYWSIIEDLYQNANALPMDCEGIAFDLHTDKKTIQSVICDFDLFVIKDGFFGSMSVQRRLDERNAKSNKAREIAMKRWNPDANALPPQSQGNAIKESKGKDIKGEKEEEEPPKGGEVKKSFVPNFDSYPTPYRQGLKDWWGYKVEKKQKYTQMGWDALVEKALKMNAAKFSELVKNSMANNWAGLHEPKTSDKTPAQETKRRGNDTFDY